jgi:cell division protein FtsB
VQIKWKKIIGNKFFIAIIIFLVIIFFLDDNNLLERFKLSDEKRELNEQIEFYDSEIKDNNRKLEELKTDSENLEKFAREEYFMKKDNEDVYIIVEEEEK